MGKDFSGFAGRIKYNSYLCTNKKPGFFTSIRYLGEELPGLRCKITNRMRTDKTFLEKIFSEQRMRRYFDLYPTDDAKAIEHYRCNLRLAECCYPSLSVFEVALRNAISRELARMTGRDDWYAVFPTTTGLKNLNRYITQATNQITARHETVTPSKITAELTLGFWVSLFNSEYELILWKDLRRAFPNMPKTDRKRKNVSAPLNKFRTFRNRVFHNESICWNLSAVELIHSEMLRVMGWIDRDLPEWIEESDSFDTTCTEVRGRMSWN